jgi:hypothetical protein
VGWSPSEAAKPRFRAGETRRVRPARDLPSRTPTGTLRR